MDWTVSWFAVFLIGVARAAMEAARQECPQIVTEYMLTTYRVCHNLHDKFVSGLVNSHYVPDSTGLSCYFKTNLNEISPRNKESIPENPETLLICELNSREVLGLRYFARFEQVQSW